MAHVASFAPERSEGTNDATWATCVAFSRYHRSRLVGGVFGWIAAVLHTFRDKCSLFQSKYVGRNFGSTAPRK